MFWAQGDQNEPNGSKIVPINVIKIFHEHDVNDVKKLESSVFCSRGRNELTAVNFFQSPTSKFFVNTTNMITRKLESNVLGTGGQDESNGSKIVPINVIKIFYEHNVNDVKKVGIKCFWAQGAKMILMSVNLF